MPDANYMDDVHVRMLRVTEDLRAIQRELNCAAMQAPGDPELMEALSQLPEIESLELLKSALDQMRHFLWFYVQVMTSGAEPEPRPQPDRWCRGPMAAKEATLIEKLKQPSDAALLRYYADSKNPQAQLGFPAQPHPSLNQVAQHHRRLNFAGSS